MSTEETIRKTLQRTTLEARSDSRVQALLSGDMAPGDLRELFRNFIVTHLNSVQILSFLFAVAPSRAVRPCEGEPAGGDGTR